MTTLRNLMVVVGANTAEFQQKMEGVGKKMADVGKKMTDVGKSMTKNVTVPILGVAAAATGLAVKYAGMGDDIAKTATKLGVSTDALQEMEYWAGQNGVAAESLERAVGRLNQRIGRAIDGNEKYGEAFQNLGVSLQTATGDIRPTEEVMYDVVAALREIESPAERSAAAAEVFGTKMARDLMPALEDSSLSLEEAAQRIHELGGVMSEDMVRDSEKFTDSLDDLKRSFEGLWMEVASHIIPIFNDVLIPMAQNTLIPMISRVAEVVGGLAEWFGNLSPPMQTTILAVAGLAAAIGPVLIVAGKLITTVGAIIPIVTKMGTAIATLAAGPAAPFILIGIAVAGLAALIYFNFDKISQFFKDVVQGWRMIWEGFRDFFVNLWDTIAGGMKGIVNGIIALVNKMISGLNKFSIDVPSWVTTLTGMQQFGFSIPLIPKLAKGGLIREQGLALVGERGPELLHLPKGAAVEPLTSGAGGAASFNITIREAYMNTEGDIERLARKLDDRMRARSRRV